MRFKTNFLSRRHSKTGAEDTFVQPLVGRLSNVGEDQYFPGRKPPALCFWKRSVWLALGLLLLLAHPVPQVSQVKPSASSPVPAGNFSDATSSSGVHFVYRASHTSKKYLLETMGAGVALFDYDNDGCLDVFLLNGAPLSVYARF
jgi:hypothetical protein